MHRKDGTCYLCMNFDNNFSPVYPLQEHHVVFGHYGSGRKLSESYGLKVYLCVWHHLATGGPDAVHRSIKTKEYLCKEAQKAFEEKYPNLSFLEIFGKNYLEDEDSKRQQDEDNRQQFGFIPIDDGIEGMEW